mmetsp:Transcript_12013/g.23936  ORF Transcript_12013/g.23936 Transcript_12013/m.23936 type:complete len:324 (+) Transcript_12013:483-1454(+)
MIALLAGVVSQFHFVEDGLHIGSRGCDVIFDVVFDGGGVARHEDDVVVLPEGRVGRGEGIRDEGAKGEVIAPVPHAGARGTQPPAVPEILVSVLGAVPQRVPLRLAPVDLIRPPGTHVDPQQRSRGDRRSSVGPRGAGRRSLLCHDGVARVPPAAPQPVHDLPRLLPRLRERVDAAFLVAPADNELQHLHVPQQLEKRGVLHRPVPGNVLRIFVGELGKAPLIEHRLRAFRVRYYQGVPNSVVAEVIHDFFRAGAGAGFASFQEGQVRVAVAHVAHWKDGGRGAELRVGVRVFRFLLFAAARGRTGGVAYSVLAASAGGSQAK